MKAIFLGLTATMMTVAAMAQSTSGSGFPPFACSANYVGQNYLDTTHQLSYTCVNTSDMGYVWQLGGKSSLFPVTVPPSGSCAEGLPNQQVISTGAQYSCQNGTWGQSGGGVTPSGIVLGASAWTREGQIFSNAAEPSVLYEQNAQLLAVPSTTYVFKAWYDGCGGTCYAESQSALPGSWTVQGSAALTGYERTDVLHVGATYYFFGCAIGDQTHIDVLTSSTGTSFTLAQANIITTGTSGQWDDSTISTGPTYYDGTTWKMLYQGARSTTTWQMGLATASSPNGPWTKYVSNPVVTTSEGPGGAITGSTSAYVDANGNVWIWPQGSGYSGTDLPTDIYRMKGDSAWVTWRLSPILPVIPRLSSIEGIGNVNGQVADASVVQANGKTYLFYSTLETQSGPFGVSLAIANMPLSQLVTTDEGAGQGFLSPMLGPANTIPIYTASQFPISSLVNLLAPYSLTQTIMGNGAGNTLITGTGNTGFGTAAMAAVTSGANNTALGGDALLKLTSGSRNIGLGTGALQNLTTTNDNIAIGAAAQQSATTATNNVSIGTSALATNISGPSNVAVGSNALAATTATGGTAVGTYALDGVTDGSQNVAVGYNTGLTIVHGADNTFLGTSATSTADTNWCSAVGFGSSCSSSGEVELGDSHVTQMCFSGESICWYKGAGAPSSALCTSSNIGSLYSNTSGGASTTLYVCTAAATWTAK